MRVFVTGGSGYIGLPTIRALVRAGHEVNGLARTESAADVLKANGAAVTIGTLQDLETLHSAAFSADAVIHLAQHKGRDFAAIDLAAAQAMIEGLDKRGPYIHTSGGWVYGSTSGLADEGQAINPPKLVAWRAANDSAVLDWAASGHQPVVILPGMVYGNHGGILWSVFAKDGPESIPCIGEGTNHWPVIHVEDLAQFYVCALTRAQAGQRYIAVSDENPRTREVLAALSRALGAAGELVHLSHEDAKARFGVFAEAFALDQQFTARKARADLGWAPAHRQPLDEVEHGR